MQFDRMNRNCRISTAELLPILNACVGAVIEFTTRYKERSTLASGRERPRGARYYRRPRRNMSSGI